MKDYQTGTSGGNLEIASGSNVVLSGQNEYTGTTTVHGELKADASGLGDTSLLVVKAAVRTLTPVKIRWAVFASLRTASLFLMGTERDSIRARDRT